VTYLGEIRGGVVVLEQGVRLAEGTVVRVEPVTTESASGTGKPDALFQMGDLAVETGIPDLATNADHYLYGHPRVNDAS
jgi:hypothetical protein